MRSIELIELLVDPVGRKSVLYTIAVAKQLYRSSWKLSYECPNLPLHTAGHGICGPL